ncbi:Bifunctional monodehydroascorbate reductase and carbonic anhydrase nectarin-3 [Platanthera zijinensis]|uniref:Bifunctional monodehydroascorbate reductase and carbonic anhydrase nectarin-3 n=1 Tax=Platanthera zijinensis TaxID=2320716 RepID=A0AAP0AWX3_9ASPA
MQSPISIDDKNVMPALLPDEFRWNYVPKNAVMKNIGHGIMIEWEDAVGAVWINGTEYRLKQMHWHIPSENSFNGHRFSLELHCLHQNAIDQKMAMVSIIFEVGKPDRFIAKVEKHIGTIRRKVNAAVSLGLVDPAEVIRDFRRYYRFQGSITVPPCTEGVTWTVNREVRTISMEQLELLKGAVMPEYANNARPQQHLNDRLIQLFA